MLSLIFVYGYIFFLSILASMQKISVIGTWLGTWAYWGIVFLHATSFELKELKTVNYCWYTGEKTIYIQSVRTLAFTYINAC
jgi:hypothetical protein